MSLKYISFKSKLYILIMVFAAVLVGVLGLVQYNHVSNELKSQHEYNQDLVQNRIVSVVKSTDMTYFILERNYEKTMRDITKAIIEEYEQKKDISKVNIADFIENSNIMDVYIIDSNNVISYTTDENDKGIKFSDFPGFVNFLDRIRKSKEFICDRLTISMAAKELKKFSYQSTKDGKYIIEIGVNMIDFTRYLKTFGIDFLSVSEEIINTNQNVEDVTLFSDTGKSFFERDQYGDAVKVDISHTEYLKEAAINNKVVEVEGIYKGKKVLYRYIPIEAAYAQSTNKMNVLEIIFNNNNLISSLNKTRNNTFIAMLIAILMSMLIARFASGFITRPISRMVDGIQRITEGDFDYRTNINSNDEFKTLSKSFDAMVQRIQDLLSEREKKEEELLGKNTEIASQRDEINSLYEQTNAMNQELFSFLDEIKKSYLVTVKVLANAIEAKDKYTKGHCERVTKYSILIARVMGLTENQLSTLEFAAILHDIGKIGIPTNILNKSSKLSDEEFELIKKHPQIGYEIVRDVEFLEESAKILRQHHERIDGKGYPYGLRGDEIDMLGRILAVADSYDAMTSNRPYRETPLSIKEAIVELQKNKGTQFDPVIVDVFVEILEEELESDEYIA